MGQAPNLVENSRDQKKKDESSDYEARYCSATSATLAQARWRQLEHKNAHEANCKNQGSVQDRVKAELTITCENNGSPDRELNWRARRESLN